MTITTNTIPMKMKMKKGKKGNKSFCKGNRAKAKLRCKKKMTYKKKKK
jgi:hypothetical protein